MHNSSNPIERRLRHLETVWPKPRCPTRLGRPHRVVHVDPVTDDELEANMPGTGCPDCGSSVYREYRLVVDHSDVA